jgi:hypothetical protein
VGVKLADDPISYKLLRVQTDLFTQKADFKLFKPSKNPLTTSAGGTLAKASR